ncbi:hypothetical protein [Sulfobacillus thermosulfidooxidans]|uniref:hypothetical protein n=1 Tax=Sulfobacillus thermosulfidooxidans TaxID=28034 RepID=UPI0006B3FABF|nr:hypothetical protein [Sulfobacillus thermosulfidooxidans]
MIADAAWGLASLGFAILVWSVWQWRSMPKPLTWQPKPMTWRVPPTLNASWIALTGLSWSPRQLQRLNALLGISVGILVTGITRNPLMGLAFVAIAWGWPEGAVRWWARRQWNRLDQQALSACTSIQFALDDHRPVLPVWEKLYTQNDDVLHRFLEPCLSGEATGRRQPMAGRPRDAQADQTLLPFEAELKAQARAIRHIELQLVADVLVAERQRGHTADLLATVLHLWSQRMEADARRRGQIYAGTRLSKLLVVGSLVLLAGLWVSSPGVVQSAQHGLGFVVFGVATGLIALGTWVQRQAERTAEQV